MPKDSMSNVSRAGKLEKDSNYRNTKDKKVKMFIRSEPVDSRLSALGSEATLIYQILENEPMTTNDLVACLMSEPYKLRYVRIINELNLLLLKGLIEIFAFKPDRTANFKVEVCLTTSPVL